MWRSCVVNLAVMVKCEEKITEGKEVLQKRFDKERERRSGVPG